jgi:hypothetical protein
MIIVHGRIVATAFGAMYRHDPEVAPSAFIEPTTKGLLTPATA